MKKNMGIADRVIRSLIAIVIGVLLVTGTVSGLLATILGIFAIVFLATSLVSFCPLYLPFSISTLRGNKDAKQ